MNSQERSLVMDSLSPTRRRLLGTVAALGVLPGAARSGHASASQTPGSPSRNETELLINGERVAVALAPSTTLLDALREQTALLGTKKGCDFGACGACTVHVDGHRVLACLTLAVRCEGKHVTTIEGLAEGDALHPVQAAFVAHDAMQCGYCTPGQIMSAVALIQEGHAHGDDEIREWMSGNICRCGAYPNIVAAIRDASTSKAG
jgi:xanthine dehydrogenase YagT iron-sulfur-binding subunit